MKRIAVGVSAEWRCECRGPDLVALHGPQYPSLDLCYRALNARGVATARGGEWTAAQVGAISRRVQPV